MVSKRYGGRQTKHTGAPNGTRERRATGRAYIVWRGEFPAYIIHADGSLDRWNIRPHMPERLETMAAWIETHNAGLDELDRLRAAIAARETEGNGN